MKITSRVLPFLAAALLGAVAARAEDRPAATVAGEPIPLAAVDELVKAQLMEIRSREHQLRSQALDALVAQSLLAKEAKARGVSEEALEKAEILDKAVVPEAESRAYYEANKARIGSMAEDEAMKQIREGLAQQRQGERRAAFAKELRAKYDVKILLEPFRVAITLGDAPVRGAATAPVTVLEFSDFQCPYCVRSRPVVAKIREAYGDKVRWAFRHYPLSFHERAQKAGEAAACAGDQGRFWEMHDRLFANQGALTPDALKSHARAVGLDGAKFDACLDSGRMAPSVEASRKLGDILSLSSTPAFFINGRPLTGALPFERFKELVDWELAHPAR